MPSAENIVVVLPNWVGDAVMATPALRALRSGFADGRITHVGKPAALEVLDGCELADEAMTDISGQRPRAINFLRQVGRMRRQRFDLAVLLPNSFRSALLCKLARIGRIAGYDRDGRGWILTDKLAPRRDGSGGFEPIPMIDYYNVLAGSLGVQVDSRQMSLVVTPAAAAVADEHFNRAGIDQSRPVVMLNPGAAFGTSKLWPAERYAAVADELIDRRGAQIIINAAPGEREIAANVVAAMRRPPALNLGDCDNSLSLLKAALKRSDLLITNDTGARHVAAAIGTGVVTIFGSTDPRWARIDYPRERTVRLDVPCSPCQQKFCPNRPGDQFHQCMTAITVEMVLDAAEQLLDQPDQAKAEAGS